MFKTLILNPKPDSVHVSQWLPNELQQVLNELRQDIADTAKECHNLIPEESGNNVQTRATISAYFHSGQDNIKSGVHMLFEKLYSIYNDTPIPVDDSAIAQHPKSIQPYMNEFHFVKQCSNDIEIIRSWNEAVKNTIRRIKDMHAVESAIASSAPVDFKPVIAPYLLDNIIPDFWNQANENSLLKFIGKIETHFLSIISKLNDEVMEQTTTSAKSLLANLNISSELSDAAKEELNTKIDLMLNDAMQKMNTLNDNVMKDLKEELNEFVAGDAKPYSTVSTICHYNANEIARRMNEIGMKKVNDFITLYESVYGLYNNTKN